MKRCLQSYAGMEALPVPLKTDAVSIIDTIRDSGYGVFIIPGIASRTFSEILKGGNVLFYSANTIKQATTVSFCLY